MAKKLALNVFYNIAIFICFVAIYQGFTGKRYEFILAGAFVAAIFIVLKIKLIKEMRNSTKKP
jgi:hypothetical protein